MLSNRLKGKYVVKVFHSKKGNILTCSAITELVVVVAVRFESP
jgi:hypothetical protein